MLDRGIFIDYAVFLSFTVAFKSLLIVQIYRLMKHRRKLLCICYVYRVCKKNYLTAPWFSNEAFFLSDSTFHFHIAIYVPTQIRFIACVYCRCSIKFYVFVSFISKILKYRCHVFLCFYLCNKHLCKNNDSVNT